MLLKNIDFSKLDYSIVEKDLKMIEKEIVALKKNKNYMKKLRKFQKKRGKVMELYIRSQDKLRLFKVSQLEVREDYYSESEIKYAIASINVQNTYGYNILNLGSYKTKERALEVLDEIQKILQPKPLIKKYEVEETRAGYLPGFGGEITISAVPGNIQYNEISTYVYEMPEE